MEIMSLYTYISNYGWIETEVSTKHVRESINTLLGVLHMTIDTQMAVVGREGERRRENREKIQASKRQIKTRCARAKLQHIHMYVREVNENMHIIESINIMQSIIKGGFTFQGVE